MKQIALLRGINVGGNNKVNMASLKVSFESLGYKDVVTYINSGNVIFTNPKDTTILKMEREVQDVIKKDFGLDIKVTIKNTKQINTLYSKIPKDWFDNKKLKINILFFLNKDSLQEFLEVFGNSTSNELIVCNQEVIIKIDKQFYTESNFINLPKHKLYKQITIRNLNTVKKIKELIF